MRRNEKLGVDRDELAAIIRLRFEKILVETGDWRPVADYVMDLLDFQSSKAERTGEFDHVINPT
jgi:hypothetical protein